MFPILKFIYAAFVLIAFTGLFILIGKVLIKLENNDVPPNMEYLLNNHIKNDILEVDKEEYMLIYNKERNASKEKNRKKRSSAFSILIQFINQIVISLLITGLIVSLFSSNSDSTQGFFWFLFIYIVTIFLFKYLKANFNHRNIIIKTDNIFIKTKKIYFYAGIPEDRKLIQNMGFFTTEITDEIDILFLIYKRGGNALINTSNTTSSVSSVSHVSRNGHVYSDTYSTTTTAGDIVLLQNL
ncbi:MAG: hypothetical protein COA39_011985 [Sulfurimonas sp.]|nr:hypothetical protein [Sulfurimonas sp.]